LFAEGDKRQRECNCMSLFPDVLNMSGGVSEDTNGRSEPGIGFGFISQFSNEWSVLVK